MLGPGGVGKTRLSRQVGAATARAFPDGVWLVELADVRDPELVTLAVAETLRLRDDTAAALPRLLDFLAPRRLLLILDNCEHLVDACAELVARIVAATAQVRVLATSREVLGVPGEQMMPVRPLPVAADDSDALRLLLARVGAADPAFAATPANRATLTAICRRLDGVPLALELAALRFRVLSPEQILDRLDDTMGLLRAGPRTAPPRQRTIADAIGWSYDLCTPSEQQLWQQLSVFSGGLDLDAAEAVGEPGAVVDTLAGLVDKSVLIRRDDGAVARYTMLEPIRQFGYDRLVRSGGEQAARARHREYYCALGLRGHRAYRSGDDLRWFRRLSREHANIRAALQFSLVDSPAVALETATALRPFWEHYRFLSEGYRWLTDALERAPEPTPERARALSSAASLAALLSDRESAARLIEDCRALAMELGAADILAEARLGTALIAFTDGDTATAFALSEQAAALARESARPSLEMDSLSFGFMCATLLEDERSTAVAAALLAVTAEHGPRLMGGLAHWTAGIDRWRHGDQDAAARFLRRAIEMFAQFDRCVWLASAFDGMAWSAAARGEPVRAARLMGAAQSLELSSVRLAQAITGAVGEKVRARVRTALGEDGFRAAVAAGAALPLPAAIDYALERAPAAAEPVRPDPIDRDPYLRRGADMLTRREKEVARLIAAGYSNKRIAAELVISVRTAETHVEHILTKLGFGSRTQVAGWVRDHAL
ncbi:LuxR family transcriptional regulator [Nocardia terpenica]|nr:LuxR family transcriptional regulator [Nocardia terpenica]MBF6108389.1 LuxR family transcriptional regulator [Nocardia terpenica]MBF6115963.1 LuxR family transcriptional regulator [Nocardia terpenica]MBF6123093.1 LuxR family transcriptional regulator [Nocardia terpenica]MBF6156233.1 LuxR family transcriptional regulator [Nocardia terpenica]